MLIEILQPFYNKILQQLSCFCNAISFSKSRKTHHAILSLLLTFKMWSGLNYLITPRNLNSYLLASCSGIFYINYIAKRSMKRIHAKNELLLSSYFFARRRWRKEEKMYCELLSSSARTISATCICRIRISKRCCKWLHR